jgi:hypothetical protein
VEAAMVILRAEDAVLKAKILNGRVPLLEGAGLVRKRAELVNAYRNASTEDRVEFARVIGPEEVFDGAVVPPPSKRKLWRCPSRAAPFLWRLSNAQARALVRHQHPHAGFVARAPAGSTVAIAVASTFKPKPNV